MKLLCWAISSPRSQVSERRNVAGELSHVLAQGGHHRSRVLAGHLHQHAEARMTLHQRGHVAVARPAQQIAFPMAGNGAIFDFRRSFADGNGIDDLALGVPVNAGVPRAADPPLGAKVLNQLLFQRSARLHEQAAINGFVRHAQALVVGILHFSHPEICLRRPVLHQFTRNDLLQLAVGGQPARLGPQGRLPGLLIGFVGSILRAPAMAGHLPAYRGGKRDSDVGR